MLIKTYCLHLYIPWINIAVLATPDKNFVKICNSEQKLLHFIAGAKVLVLHDVITYYQEPSLQDK